MPHPLASGSPTRDVRALRPPRAHVSPWQPYASLIESECSRQRTIDDVATLFLVNSECPFSCVFCDLWKHTLTEPTPQGAIPAQIDHALKQLGLPRAPDAPAGRPWPQHIKLYNSGNFFDRRAIPQEDWPAIAERVRPFQTVIVENHPSLCGDDCLRFRDLIAPARLEVAMGLETVHPEILPRLNKGMTLDDFEKAARFLRAGDVDVRAFILLCPPWLPVSEGPHWALQSVHFAFDCGADCASIIPVRAGNGWMDERQREGDFAPPRLTTMESALEQGVALKRGRVLMDLWDANRFADCRECASDRIARLQAMNLTQRLIPPIRCLSPSCDARSAEISAPPV